MKILSVNAGSSSLKFTLFEMPEEKELVKGLFERIGMDGSKYTIKLNGEKIVKEVPLPNHEEAFKVLMEELKETGVISSYDEIKGIGHRVVQGGDIAKSVVINDEVIKKVEEFTDLAPLHNPACLTGIRAALSVVPNAVQTAVFDTAFHQTMDEEQYLYAVPYEWYTEYKIRKYGYHGTSHKYVSLRMNEILGRHNTKLITCHIGNGASISAVLNGECIDTSMGLTPNAGLMMGTRCGDIDANIIPFVMGKTKKSAKEIETILNKESGLLGISGVSSDSRDIEEGINTGNLRCRLAQRMYVKKIIDYIAMYYVELGGADAIVFTAGVGENSKGTRQEIMDGLAALGIKCDAKRNDIRGEEALISADDSTVPCYVIPTNEELMIALDTMNLINE